MRVAIAGAGNVGQHVASSLLEAGHEVLLIEQTQSVVDRATLPSGIEWYVGDACEVASLREAGLVDSHRRANIVLHTLTPLGAALLRLPSHGSCEA